MTNNVARFVWLSHPTECFGIIALEHQSTLGAGPPEGVQGATAVAVVSARYLAARVRWRRIHPVNVGLLALDGRETVSTRDPVMEEDLEMARLDGKTALITGATGGIGEATARRYLEEGARVVLVGRSQEKLRATRERLSAFAGVAQCVAEATDEDDVKRSVSTAVEQFGGLDILVANAGTEGVLTPLTDQTVESFNQVLNTNVTGVWLAIKHSVPVMKERGAGSIIATSSIGGMIGFAGLGPYIASKHAVFGLVKTACLEFAEAGIRVNAIGPGPVDNRMIASLENQLSPEDPSGVRTVFEGMVPMKRYASNEEVANLALFLGSDESTYCNGAMYLVDGGWTAA